MFYQGFIFNSVKKSILLFNVYGVVDADTLETCRVATKHLSSLGLVRYALMFEISCCVRTISKGLLTYDPATNVGIIYLNKIVLPFAW